MDLPDDVTASLDFDTSVQAFITEDGAEETIKTIGDRTYDVYPKLAHDLAAQWDGKPIKTLNKEFCEQRIEGKAPCHVTIRDTRLIDPTTASDKFVIFSFLLFGILFILLRKFYFLQYLFNSFNFYFIDESFLYDTTNEVPKMCNEQKSQDISKEFKHSVSLK